MVVKVKESFEKTKHVKNKDKLKKYILRGHRNVRYYEKILKYNIILSSFSKMVIDKMMNFSTYTYILITYRMMYHSLL